VEWESISAAQRTLNECWSVPDQPAAGNLSESAAFRLGQKVKILRTCLHGMNEKLVALSNRRTTSSRRRTSGSKPSPSCRAALSSSISAAKTLCSAALAPSSALTTCFSADGYACTAGRQARRGRLHELPQNDSGARALPVWPTHSTG
jgi:hypothetical protein